MKIIVHHFPQTRSNRVLWLLEEMGIPYDLRIVDLRKGQHKDPEYLKLNPFGMIPAVELDGKLMAESAAICMHLAQVYSEKGFAASPGSVESAEILQWLCFCTSTLENPLVEYFQNTQFFAEEQRDPKRAAEGKEKFSQLVKIVESALVGRDFLVGNRMSAADIVMGSVLGWAQALGLATDCPEIARYGKSLRDRPAFQATRKI